MWTALLQAPHQTLPSSFACIDGDNSSQRLSAGAVKLFLFGICMIISFSQTLSSAVNVITGKKLTHLCPFI